MLPKLILLSVTQLLDCPHPLGNTGATWSLDYIFGGYTRDETKQK